MRKAILITLIVIVVAIFTGSWIFGLFGTIFHFLGNICDWGAKIFNFFGWNGLLAIGGIYV